MRRPQDQAKRPEAIAGLDLAQAAGAAVQLLKLESDLRSIRTLDELGYFAVNETRFLTRAQQSFLFSVDESKAPSATAISSITEIDRTSPIVVLIEGVVSRLKSESGLDAVREFDVSAYASSLADQGYAYPLRFLVWLPLKDVQGRLIAGLLQARMTPWTEAELTVSRHIAGAVAQTMLALRHFDDRRWRAWTLSRRKAALIGAATIAIGAVPVAMTALAPVEVTPSRGFVVTAPLEGVVDTVLVQPNTVVTKDQPLLRLTDTVLRNRLAITEREVQVADARVKKSAQLAFSDARGRHDLGVAQAELELKLAERDYARDVLERSIIKADRSGVVFFSDQKDLVGRPVAVGERLMEIAEPSQLEFRIDLPVADAIIVNEGARVKVFLDSDPLRPIEAKLVRADFQARVRDGQTLSLRLVAERVEGSTGAMRLGVRGTAQIYSSRVSLAFYLFRRPISAARQWFGI
jgi:multidrug efflux pump subunit AcrA (membrane-fusion protein)